ncbi:MAG: hypothetical protein O2816_03815 [Planctomycetota bacterium]|nr:hypothetical protein [Planctomycetota bacterium]
MLTALLLTALTAADVPQDPVESMYSSQLSPTVELWSEVRYQAAQPGEPSGPLAGAVSAARELGTVLSNELAWRPFTAAVMSSHAGALLGAEVKLPAFLIAEGHTRKELRAAYEALFAILDSIGPAWIEAEWPKRKPALEEALRAVDTAYDPDAQAAVLPRMDRWIGMPAPKQVCPIHWVTRAATPGSISVISDGLPACIIAVEGRGTSTLVEILIRELMYAAEAQPINPPSLFREVTGMMIDFGVRKPELHHSYSHTLYFIGAAELVRAVIDPEHVDYGIQEGYYATVPREYEVLKPAWDGWINQEYPRFRIGKLAAAAAREDLGKQ